MDRENELRAAVHNQPMKEEKITRFDQKEHPQSQSTSIIDKGSLLVVSSQLTILCQRLASRFSTKEYTTLK
jgi:hypothetical protein